MKKVLLFLTLFSACTWKCLAYVGYWHDNRSWSPGEYAIYEGFVYECITTTHSGGDEHPKTSWGYWSFKVCSESEIFDNLKDFIQSWDAAEAWPMGVIVSCNTLYYRAISDVPVGGDSPQVAGREWILVKYTPPVDNFILIHNAQELDAVRNGLDKHYKLANDIDLTAFLSDKPAGWTPVGTEQEPFTGSLDGNRHVITGLKIATTSNNAGLFGWMRSPAVVKNLEIEASGEGVKTTANYAGILAAANGDNEHLGGEITNCYVKGKVSATTYVGGFFGITSGNMKNCFANVTVTGGDNTGALTGSYKQVAGLENPQMKHCYATGEFGKTGSDIVGTSASTIYTNCYMDENMAANPIHAQKLTVQQLKTQASFVNWDFKNTWMFSEDVNPEYEYPVLRIFEPNSLTNPILIYDVRGMDEIRDGLDKHYKLANNIDLTENQRWFWTSIGTGYSSTTAFTGTLDGDGYAVTGLWQQNTDAYNGLFYWIRSPAVIKNLGIETIYEGVTTTGNYAGILAAANGNNNYPGGEIINCYVKGKVLATTYSGGFFGISSGKMENCYADVTVTGGSHTGALSGMYTQSTGSESPEMKHCYAIGSFTNQGADIVGTSTIAVYTNCYINEAMASTPTHATKLTGLQMEDRNSFENWDFTETWEISDRYLCKYPVLRMMKNNAPDCSIVISEFPWAENFENAIELTCWGSENVSGDVNWKQGTGSGTSSGITTARGGEKNMYLYNESYISGTTKYITPKLDISELKNPVLKFWYAQKGGVDEQNELSVYYKTSAEGTWSKIFENSSNVEDWAEVILGLPESTDDYYIAFEGTERWRGGISLDDVSVEDLLLNELTPPDVSTNVAIDAVVSAAFSTNIAAANLSEITIIPNPGNVSASVSDNILIIARNNFDYETEYTVTVPAGTIEGYTETFSWSFTTMPEPAPVITGRTPDEDGVDVALNAPVSVTFDRNITGVDLTNISISPNVNATASVNGTVLSIAHADFDYNTRYTVTVPAGSIANYDEAISWSFTTISGTGISDAGLANINLYPNPAQTRVTFTGLPENATVALYDMGGNQIRQYEADYMLNINIDFESGTYLVKVEKDGQSVVKKLIVE